MVVEVDDKGPFCWENRKNAEETLLAFKDKAIESLAAYPRRSALLSVHNYFIRSQI